MIKHTHPDGAVSVLTDLTLEQIENIKRIKEEKEIGLNELAQACDINKSQMSKFFNLKMNISVNKFLAVIDTLGYKIQLVPKHK